MRDAFGVSKAFGLKPAAKALGKGPGTQLKPGASLALKPKPPASNFVHADESAIKAFTVQRQRAAMKASFR